MGGETGAMRVGARRGFGIVMSSLGALVAVLSCAIYACYFGSGVATETMSTGVGRRALDVARSCLDETLLEFKATVNRPGTSWYQALRERFTRPEGMAWWLRGAMPAGAAGQLAPDARMLPVRASVWRDEPIAREAGQFDEKFALLTLTADVEVSRGMAFPFRGVVRREVQRTYHLRQVRVVAPQPFGKWTLYVHRVPQIEASRQTYDELVRKFWSRREELKRSYGQEILDIIATLERYLVYMRRKVGDWDKAQREIDDAKEQLQRLIAVTPLSLGLAVPWVVQLQDAIDGMKAKLKRDKETNLAAFALPDEATFRRVAANPYAPQQLVRDIAFELLEGAWPDFRGWRGTPRGLEGPGDDLGMPIVVKRDRVTSREIDYRLPAPPELPRRPTYSLASRDIQWLAQYSSITAEFRRYMSEYDAMLKALIEAYRGELSRHEQLFRLLSGIPPEYDRLLTSPEYHGARATWFFDDQESFEMSVTGPGGSARLDGAYAVKGALSRFPAAFRGRGYVYVEEGAKLAGVRRDSPAATLVVHSGRDVELDGSCEGAVLAPQGRLHSSDAGRTVGLAVVREIAREDEFTVQRAPELGDAGPAGLWVNVSPARLAGTILRDPKRLEP